MEAAESSADSEEAFSRVRRIVCRGVVIVAMESRHQVEKHGTKQHIRINKAIRIRSPKRRFDHSPPPSQELNQSLKEKEGSCRALIWVFISFISHVTFL